MNRNLNLFYKPLFTLCLLIAFSAATHAVVPVVHISPKPSWISAYKPYVTKPADRDIENGAYSALIEEQVNVEEEATYNHFITQIVSASGVQNNSEISVSFDPSYQRLDFHDITVWRNNKPQSRLNNSAFKLLAQEDELEKFLYDGTYAAKYVLADIRKGDKIEYSYTITGINPIFNHQFSRSIYLQGGGLIAHQYTTLLFSAKRKIQVKSFNLKSQAKITRAGAFIRYEWEDFQVPGVSTNKLQPKWINDYARVQVSDLGTWADVINWGLKLNPVQTTFNGELADSIAKLKKQSGGNKERYFRAAVTLVQDEIRYMGIETGPYSHKANSPEKVFKQRFGDCKDKSLLLASILTAGGIEAHLALINTALQDKIENYLPANTLFDHAVVVATVNGKKVWVDATMANQGGRGTDLYFPNYRVGLILKAGNTALTKIDETKKGKMICEERYDIKNEYAPVKFKVITTYTLDQADQERDHLAASGSAETEKSYLDYYAKVYSKIEATDSVVIKDDREKNVLTTIENYTIPNYFKRDSASSKFSADFYADYIAYELPAIGGRIKTPVAVNYPSSIDYTINIILPYGWDMNNEHFALKRDGYSFLSDKLVNHDQLSLHYQFAYTRDFIPVDKISEFRQDIKDLKDDKLSFSFYYIPDITKVPFKANSLMLLTTALVAGLFIYFGLKVYRTETSETSWYNSNSIPMPLGGWLIFLIIVLFGTSIGIIQNLVNGGYYSMARWNEVLAGTAGFLNRAMIIYKVIGYAALFCFSVFCLVLVFNKRDIAPRTIKVYYMFMVLFFAVGYIFGVFIKGEFFEDGFTQMFRPIIAAVLWTYYLNTAERVKRTFIIPYSN